MPSATMTSKGQFTMPAEVRKKLGFKSGKKRPIMELSGVGKWDGPPVTIEEMNEIIRRGWAELLKDDEVQK